MKKSLIFAFGLIAFYLTGCDVKTNGSLSVDQPIKVKVEDISIKSQNPLHNESTQKTNDNYFCDIIAGMQDCLCVSLVSDGEKVYYSVVLDSGRVYPIKNLALAVNGVPVVDVCQKCEFKPTIASKALIISGSANANERLGNSINSISYSILNKNRVDEFYYSADVKENTNEIDRIKELYSKILKGLSGKGELPDVSDKDLEIIENYENMGKFKRKGVVLAYRKRKGLK